MGLDVIAILHTVTAMPDLHETSSGELVRPVSSCILKFLPFNVNCVARLRSRHIEKAFVVT